jgi:hypothetical protein
MIDTDIRSQRVCPTLPINSLSKVSTTPSGRLTRIFFIYFTDKYLTVMTNNLTVPTLGALAVEATFL